MFSFGFLLFFININRDAPAPVNSPPIKEASVMELFRYNSVSITLAEQFGIKPIKLVINGPNMVFDRNILDR